MLRVTAHVAIGSYRGQRCVDITRLPPTVGAETIGTSVAARATRRQRRGVDLDDELDRELRIPLRDVLNVSSGYEERVVCIPEADADIQAVAQQILDTWPVTIEMHVQLPQPLPQLLRDFVDDPATQGPALRTLRPQSD